MDSDLSLQLRLWQQQPSKLVLAACSSDSVRLNPARQTRVLSALAHPICQLLPPSRQYIKRLIKQLIQFAEDAGEELTEEVLQLYTSLLAPVESDLAEQAQEDSAWRYKTFYYSSCPSAQQLQQLQQQHVANCLNACSQQQQQQQQQGGQQQQQQQGGQHFCRATAAEHAFAVPLLQLRQLQARQRVMVELLAAAGVQQKLTDTASQPCGKSWCSSSSEPHFNHGQCVHGAGLGTTDVTRSSDCEVQHQAVQAIQAEQHEAVQLQQQLQAVQLQQTNQQQQLQAGHLSNAGQQLCGVVPAVTEEAVQQQQQQQQQQPAQLPQQHEVQQAVQQQQEAVQQVQHQQQQHHQPAQHSTGLLSVHMSDNLFEGGTGCHMWDAGFLLAEFVLNHQHLFIARSCLEIGCGPGLVAACLARLQPKQLLLTDGDPQTLVNCISNMALNGHAVKLLGGWQEAVNFTPAVPSVNFTAAQNVNFKLGTAAVSQQQQQATSRSGKLANIEQVGTQIQVLACPLDWHADVPGLWADVIVGSDILYDPAAVPSVVRLLGQLLGAPGAPAGRSHKPHTNPNEFAKSGDAKDSDLCSATEVTHATVQDGVTCSGHANNTCQCCDYDTTTSTCVCDQDVVSRRRGSVAYLSTTRRQPSTLKLFEDLAAAAGLVVQELSMQPGSWREQPVVFFELPALQEREMKFVLHRVTAL